MSDILIKNVKMPKNCEGCKLIPGYCKHRNIYCMDDNQKKFIRPKDCPLVEVPSADAEEVVRCKDCKNNYVTTHNHGKQDDPRCDFTDRHLSLDDFCSRGERRMDGGT